MTTITAPTVGWLRASDCRLSDFTDIVEQATDPVDYPHTAEVVQNVLVYDAAPLSALGAVERAAVQAEIAHGLLNGPGIAVFRGAFADTSVVDRVTAAFDAIIADEAAEGVTVGDHFAKPGANSRLWNALEKLAERDPEAFVDYYANDTVGLAATAWLGPNYQVTSAVNVVRPGGQAQDPHRDYHLGFLDDELAERFPAHVHQLSQVLTLQGAVAHTDMPVESGPTMYLPHSQKYLPGYLAWRRRDFAEYFAANFVQLPLRKGDAVFFNPALFHGAGTNYSSDIQRVANLLQISSAFGRAMEAVDRTAISTAVYPALLDRRTASWSDRALGNALASAAEGYPFPTNLDRDQPIGRMTPESQAEVVWTALQNGDDQPTLTRLLNEHAHRRLTG